MILAFFYAQDSARVFISERYESTPVFLCSFPPMDSVRVGAFKVRTTEQVSRRSIGGLLKERLNGGQLKIFQRLSRNVRPVDAGLDEVRRDPGLDALQERFGAPFERP